MNYLWIGAFFGCYLLYKRFFPVDVNCVHPEKIELNETTVILDLRDYNLSAKQPIKGAFVLPYAYLKRYHSELKGKQIYLVAPDTVVRNLSIRYLKRKGYDILGCSIIKENYETETLEFQKCS